MSLLISQCTRTRLRCVLSLPPSTLPRVAKQPSKLRSIITQGIPQLLCGSVTKFHTNWPHQLRNPETDLYWVGWCVCVMRIVWRETCIIKVASLWKPRRLDAGWLQTVASFYFILSYFFLQRGPGWVFGIKQSGCWSVLAHMYWSQPGKLSAIHSLGRPHASNRVCKFRLCLLLYVLVLPIDVGLVLSCLLIGVGVVGGGGGWGEGGWGVGRVLGV